MKPGDPGEDTQEFDDAKQKDIDGLLARGTFCSVRREEIPENENTLGGGFVCTLKTLGLRTRSRKHAMLLTVMRTRKSHLFFTTFRTSPELHQDHCIHGRGSKLPLIFT